MSVVTLVPAASVSTRRALWGGALLYAAVLAAYISCFEGGFYEILFALAAPATMGGLILVVSRKPLFSLVLTTLLVALIFFASRAKQETMNMVLHAYDIIFYFSSWSTVSFLLTSYRGHMIALAAAVAAVAVAARSMWRIDEGRVRRGFALALTFAFAGITGVAANLRAPLHEAVFFTDDRYVSAFFSSLSETAAVLWRGNLAEAAVNATGGPFVGARSCTPVAAAPHIILIHQESTVPPSYFPALEYDHSIDPFFRSADGSVRKLRVETFAGASWLSEFSILAGMSTHAFGSMRPYVQAVMAGKLRDALPQFLENCGYRNVLVYPMLRNFVANDQFYSRIGLHQVLDADDQKSRRPNERDRFFYETGLDVIAGQVKSGTQPLFLYIQTQATHGQYDFVYEPKVKVAGGGPGTDKEVHEYLRRLGMAAIDYRYLKKELARRFPDERFLIVNYGDHQPDITRKLLGPDYRRGILTMERHPNAFVTYYSADGVGYEPADLPDVNVLDVPYLGAVIMEAARLPLPDTYRERMRLMTLCKGKYHGCEYRGEILAFHRRLLNSGLMDRF
jgi:phosphoglycerol transferase MdoB-like AlkP superfamily enzyme